MFGRLFLRSAAPLAAMMSLIVTVTLKLRRVAAAMTISLLAVQDAQADNMFIGLGDLPGGSYFSRATDVSADGSTVVGFSDTADGPHAFRWTAGGGLVGLGNSDDVSFAWAVSADGSVAVGSRDYGVNGGERPYRWDTTTGVGTPINIGVWGGIAYDVSADGSVIVGRKNNGYGFRVEPYNTLKGPGDDFGAYAVSADGEIVVGSGRRYSGDPQFDPPSISWQEAAIWESPWNSYGGDVHGKWLGRLGNGDSAALAISADGTTIVGKSGEEAVRFKPDGIISLGSLPGYGVSAAQAVSADGSLVFGLSRGKTFIWDEANGMRSLEDVLETEYGLNLLGWELRSVEGVSDDGTTLVGYGTKPDGCTEAWLARLTTVVPEPSSLVLLGGLVGIGLVAVACPRFLYQGL